MTKKFTLKGLTCEACAKLAALKLKKINGVTEVSVNAINGKTEVEAARQISAEEIKQALQGTDYSIIES